MAFTTFKKWIGLLAILALPGIIYYYVTKAENHFMPLATIGVEGQLFQLFLLSIRIMTALPMPIMMGVFMWLISFLPIAQPFAQ